MTKKISKIYLLTFLLPLTAIIWRVLYRGYHYAGWEVYFAAKGLFLIKEFGFVEAIKKTFYLTRNCQYCGQDGIILNIIPGVILSIFPWEFWPHLLTFLLFIFSFWLCGISFQFKDEQWAWLALALGSSATLLSHSICGGQYVSGMLPHSLALLIIFHPYFKKNWCCGLLLGFLTIEISWHVYPLGKTIFILFFLAAFLQNNAAIKNRVVHFVLGAVSAFLIYSNNVGMGANKFQRLDNLIAISWENFIGILKVIFWEPGMDLLTIPVLGLICLLFLRKNRLLFAGILLSQWLLVLMLGFHGFHKINGFVHLRPRRFVLVDFYSIVVLLVIVKQWWPDIQKRYVKFCIYILTIILFCGNILQFMNLTEFTSIDIHEQKHSLPYTFSPADYKIRPQYEDAADILADLVNKGKKIILVYTYYTYEENRTNPEALPERLCLKLGYEKFKENIFIFTKQRRHFNQAPTIPLSEIDTTLNKIKNVNNYLVFKHPAGRDRNFKEEESIIMKAIEDKFTLEEQEKVPPFIVYKIFPHDVHYGEFIKNDVQYGEFIKTWLIMGDIPGPTNPRQIFSEDFLVENGGEQKILATEGMVHHHKDNITSKWIEYSSPTDLINFIKIFKVKKNTVAYAFTTLYSPINQKVILAVASDDSSKVWLNGELVHQEEFGRRRAEPDQDKIEVLLRKGQNTILLKVVQFHGQWGFTCRLLKNTDT